MKNIHYNKNPHSPIIGMKKANATGDEPNNYVNLPGQGANATQSNWLNNVLTGILGVTAAANTAYGNLSPIFGGQSTTFTPSGNANLGSNNNDNQKPDNTKLYIFGGLAVLIIVVLLVLIFRKK